MVNEVFQEEDHEPAKHTIKARAIPAKVETGFAPGIAEKQGVGAFQRFCETVKCSNEEVQKTAASKS